VESAKRLTVKSFQSTSNSNTINANGGMTYQGTSTNDTFTNATGATIQVKGGGALFDGLGGTNDQFTNNGTLRVLGGHSLTVRNIKTVMNTSSGVIHGTGVTALNVGGNFTNNGTFNVANGEASDVVTVGGDLKIGKTAKTMLDFRVNGTGKADHIDVTGTSTGDPSTPSKLKFNFIAPSNATYLLHNGNLNVITSKGGGSLNFSVNQKVYGSNGNYVTNDVPLNNGETTELFDFGLIDYFIHNKDGNVFITNGVNASAAGDFAASLSAAITAVTTVFQKPTSAFVSSCKQGNEGVGYGTWARGAGGNVKTDIPGSVVGSNFGFNVKNSTDYQGVQLGFDAAGCDLGSINATLHGGLTIGKVTGTTRQTNAMPFNINNPGHTNGILTVDFDTNFVGAYSALIIGHFSADMLLRYDFHKFTLNDSIPQIVSNEKVNGHTISGNFSTRYTFMLADYLQFAPGGGVSVSKTSVNKFDINSSQGTFALKDQTSIIAYAGATLQGIIQASDQFFLLPFVNVNVYSDFGDPTKATIDLLNKANVKTDTVGTFGQVGAGLNFFAPSGSRSKPNLIGGLRADTQFGSRLKGWAVTGNVRLQF